jgi:inorganic pyrophosphatase
MNKFNKDDHPIGTEYPEWVPVIIEIPLGDTRKFHLNPKEGQIKITPRMRQPLPFHYGYIPGTMLIADESQLDVVLCDLEPLEPCLEVRARVLGVIHRKDGDHKIVASISEQNLDPLQLGERVKAIRSFFDEDPTTLTSGFYGLDSAYTLIRQTVDQWQKLFKNL